MTQSRILFSVFLLSIFILPLRNALNPQKCPSSYSDSYLNKCEPLGIPIRFPFCGHPGFNLHCNNLDKTVLELPMSGTFLVDEINYQKQQISISDPENCMVKRLLTFNTSGSPFSYGFSFYYTFLTCPNEVVIPVWSLMSIPCLSNSTSSFFATSNLTFSKFLPPSCQIVKGLYVPVDVIYKDVITEEKGFSTVPWLGNVLLEWSSPNCRGCEKESLRCGFKNKASLEVKCLADPPDETKSRLRPLIITLCIIGGITATCIAAIRIYNSERFVNQRRQNAAITARNTTQQPRGVVVTTGLDQSTIESYKKVELGESRRLPGTNGIICPICLSEYASKETVRCMPECDHCFHVQCIDEWLKIHSSCPVCRNSRS